MTKSMLALRFKQYKSNASLYYFIDEKTRKFVISIVYIDNISFIDLKDFLLLLKLKQKFVIKQEYHNFGEIKVFLGICISYNCKNQKIFIDTYTKFQYALTQQLTQKVLYYYQTMCLNLIISSTIPVSIKSTSNWLNL